METCLVEILCVGVRVYLRGDCRLHGWYFSHHPGGQSLKIERRDEKETVEHLISLSMIAVRIQSRFPVEGREWGRNLHYVLM